MRIHGNHLFIKIVCPGCGRNFNPFFLVKLIFTNANTDYATKKINIYGILTLAESPNGMIMAGPHSWKDRMFG